MSISLIPPTDAVDIGEGHRISFREFKGEVAGIAEYHQKPDGTWCSGWVAFSGSAWAREFKTPINVWQVISREPLSLTPSILCRACGNHGNITNGRWVKA
jgi:hypothetical protein